MNTARYSDRTQAGRRLAGSLAAYSDRDDVRVVALPRGGVPVAFEVAQELHAPLDVIVVRKLGVPGWEELAMGAIAAGGVRVLNDDVVSGINISPPIIESVAEEQLIELLRREKAYRGDSPPLDVRDRTVLLVDDGIATGSTIRAAAQALRQLAPRKIVIAAPVGAADSCASLADVADEVIVPRQPDDFRAVGLWYEHFNQTSDAEVKTLLERASMTNDNGAKAGK